MEELKEDFPYYPNFYPPITHFPVKDEKVDNVRDVMKEKISPKFRTFYHYHPYMATNYYGPRLEHGGKVQEAMEKEAELESRKKRNVAYSVPSHLSPASKIYPK